MKRIFIGIKIEVGRNFSKLLSSLKDELAEESIKWTNPGNMHLTLAFMGDTPDDKINDLIGVLEQKCANHGSFELTLKGIGVFKNIREPKIFWAGIYQSEKLASLQNDISESLKEGGFSFDEKPFSPHLTIGRIKHINDRDLLKVFLLKHHSTEIQRSFVNHVVLFESILRKDGPEYKPVRMFNLHT
ncbi:MAG TPA: RNA 2',3'-cyclic phosphodiesterase [Bacteroidales bacterium]|nr:RNA 2',3'-cyclic phosphodiesterase [Bacteroidales bacterium]